MDENDRPDWKCPDCGDIWCHCGDCDGCHCDSPEYLEHMERCERGYPDTIPCWACWHDLHAEVQFMNGTEVAPEREVVGLGPVVGRADPTQTYKLACGHVTI